MSSDKNTSFATATPVYLSVKTTMVIHIYFNFQIFNESSDGAWTL